MDTNILLESGTNELEILEFTLGENHYGINVAKIREILTYQPVTPVPNTHPSVEGIFMPRDTMITVINLKKCLGRDEVTEKGLFIITNFNKLDIAFHVDEVIGIHRVSWEAIIKPDSTLSGEDGSVSTGVIKMDNKLVVILDFESIVSSISPETGLRTADIESVEARDRGDYTILSFSLCYRFRHILAARPLGDSIISVGPRLRYGQHMIYIGSRPRFALGLMVLVDN